jgi:hypothetical protein
LKSLLDVADHLEKGVAGVLSGTDPALGFAPWKTSEQSADVIASLIEVVDRKGVTEVTLLGFEFELLFWREGKKVYSLRTFVYTRQGKIEFFSIEGSSDARYARASSLTAYHGVAATPFKVAAEDLLRLLDGESCMNLPLVNREELMRITPGATNPEDVSRRLKSLREDRERACEELNLLFADDVQLRIDDFAVEASASGKPVGIVKGEMQLLPRGGIGVTLKSFLDFPR